MAELYLTPIWISVREFSGLIYGLPNSSLFGMAFGYMVLNRIKCSNEFFVRGRTKIQVFFGMSIHVSHFQSSFFWDVCKCCSLLKSRCQISVIFKYFLILAINYI